MASFNEELRRKKKLPIIMVLVFDLILSPLISYIVVDVLSNGVKSISSIMNNLSDPLTIYSIAFKNKDMFTFIGLLQSVVLVFILMILFPSNKNMVDNTATMKVANLQIPKPVGKGQMGTSRFSTEEEKRKYFEVWKEDTQLKSGGMVIGVLQRRDGDYYYFDNDDVNTLIVGTTRSGKSRRKYLPSIYLLANSGENIVVNDPKGELFIYSNKYLKKMGYKVMILDFRQPEKSMRYNYLNFIIEAISNGDHDNAVEMVWDLVGIFVGEAKGEKLWNDGEASVIASAIIYICMEAPKEKYKNLTNVYYFLANMCKPDENGHMPITDLYENLPITHPARAVFAVAELAPERTRGSFFTSALATLRLFTDNKIANMTSSTEIDLREVANEKVALFCIIPDEKPTRHILSTILIDQLYMTLVQEANKSGGRLKKRVNILFDEFGNMPKLNGIDNKLTVCLGRGIRFVLAVQGIAQLYKVYGKEVAEIITSNCHTWDYLLTTDNSTAEIISKRTGNYTVQSKSVSSSSSSKLSGTDNASISTSSNLVKRALLEPDEILRLDMPYSLVFKAKGYPNIFTLPDISELKANKSYGMGDQKHNLELTMSREDEREIRMMQEADIWLPLSYNYCNKDEKQNICNINFGDNFSGETIEEPKDFI